MQKIRLATFVNPSRFAVEKKKKKKIMVIAKIFVFHANAIKYYEPEKINGGFNDKYIEHKRKGDRNTSMEKYLEKIRPYFVQMIDDLRASVE